MNPPEESSLDRYLESQAGLMLSHASLRRGRAIMAVVGTCMLLVAIFIVMAALISGHHGVAGAAIGPGIAGMVNLGISRAMRSRTNPAMDVNANLTAEARAFMANLMKDVYGWPYAWGAIEPGLGWESEGQHLNKFERQHERHAWRRMIASGSWGKRQQSARQCLQPTAFEMPDKAAFQYNRVAAALASGGAEIARFAPTVKAAADQAMADMFHVGYLLDAYPESQVASQAKAAHEIAQLTELADRLEEMQKQPQAAPAISASSPIRSVLEELRLDQLARSELSKDEPQHQQINMKSGQ